MRSDVGRGRIGATAVAHTTGNSNEAGRREDLCHARGTKMRMSRTWRWTALSLGIGAVLMLVGWLTSSGRVGGANLGLAPIDGPRAFGYLEQVCRIGPRPAGSAGLEQLRELARKHFEDLGAQVRVQKFERPHPLYPQGEPVPMANLIASWKPERKDRLLVAAHYDTRPGADLDPDPRKRKEPIIGANDGGSGTALLMELAHHVGDLQTPYGIDLVFFDAEDFVFGSRGEYSLGAEHFARQYERAGRQVRYVAAIVADMIADKSLRVTYDQHSALLAKPVVTKVLAIARRLGIQEFAPRPIQPMVDDHVPLNAAGIPTCLLIDFQYPPWHTSGDTIDKCSADSLTKVGWVILEWLREMR